jgi:hypothetical protein
MTTDKALDLALEALEKSLPKLAPYGEQDWLDSRAAIKAIKQARSAPVQEPVGVYGHCPVCGAKGITRERRPGGNDRCANGHTYKSIHATTPPAQPAPVQERTDYAVHLNHCNIGECEGVCKYLDDDCPALKHADAKAKWDKPTPPAAQRQWVGLTDEDKLHIEIMGGKSDVMLAEMVEAKLKERNV